MPKMHWMKHLMATIIVTATDQFGAPSQYTVKTWPARVTYGDRYISSAAGSAVIVAVMEAYTTQEVFSYLQDYNDANIIEANNSLVETVFNVSSYADREATQNAINTALGLSSTGSGDWVAINRRSLKRSMNRRNRGYTYLARTGG